MTDSTPPPVAAVPKSPTRTSNHRDDVLTPGTPEQQKRELLRDLEEGANKGGGFSFVDLDDDTDSEEEEEEDDDDDEGSPRKKSKPNYDESSDDDDETEEEEDEEVEDDDESSSPTAAKKKSSLSAANNNSNNKQKTSTYNKPTTTTTNKNDAYSQKLERLWQANFQKLQAYKQEHGDCAVPNTYPQDEVLAQWVKTQRKAWVEDTLSEARYQQLDKLGFVWKRTAAKRTWQEHLDALQAYVNKYGNSWVPRGFEDDMTLGNWVTRHRELYAKKELDAEKMAQMEAHGMTWKRDDRAMVVNALNWEEQYSELQDYVEENGHCDVPLTLHPNLSRWVRHQRTQCRKQKLTRDQIQKLEQVGLLTTDPPPKRKRRRPQKSAATTTSKSNAQEQPPKYRPTRPEATLQSKSPAQVQAWEQHFNQLIVFHSVHGHFHPRRLIQTTNGKEENNDDSDNNQISTMTDSQEALATWVEQQRQDYKEGKLPKAWQQRLAAIGFFLRAKPGADNQGDTSTDAAVPQQELQAVQMQQAQMQRLQEQVQLQFQRVFGNAATTAATAAAAAAATAGPTTTTPTINSTDEITTMPSNYSGWTITYVNGMPVMTPATQEAATSATAMSIMNSQAIPKDNATTPTATTVGKGRKTRSTKKTKHDYDALAQKHDALLQRFNKLEALVATQATAILTLQADMVQLRSQHQQQMLMNAQQQQIIVASLFASSQHAQQQQQQLSQQEVQDQLSQIQAASAAAVAQATTDGTESTAETQTKPAASPGSGTASHGAASDATNDGEDGNGNRDASAINKDTTVNTAPAETVDLTKEAHEETGDVPPPDDNDPSKAAGASSGKTGTPKDASTTEEPSTVPESKNTTAASTGEAPTDPAEGGDTETTINSDDQEPASTTKTESQSHAVTI